MPPSSTANFEMALNRGAVELPHASLSLSYDQTCKKDDACTLDRIIGRFRLTASKGLAIVAIMILPTVILRQLIDLDRAKTGARLHLKIE